MLKKLFIALVFQIANLYGLEKVSLQIDWKHQFEYAGYYMAKEKGFYRDIGIELNIKEFEGEDPLAVLLKDETINFGVYNSRVVLSKMRGDEVILLGNFFKKSALVLISQKDIRTPLDFFGKKIMGTEDQLRTDGIGTLFKRFNISEDSYKQISPTFRVDDFVKGEIDVMTAYISNELYHLNENGVQYNIIDPANYGIYMYGDNLFTTVREMENNPERTKNFLKASIKGWEYALSHIDETIEIILKKYNSQNKSREALRFEAFETKKMIMPEVYPIGSIDKDRIKNIANTFIEIGATDNNYSLRGFLIDDFESSSIKLTSEERKFLSTLKDVKMCVDPDWMPYEKIENGKHIGMSAEYLHLVSKIIDLPINLVETKTWTETLQKVEKGECDILSLAMETEGRKKFLEFTDPYFTFPLVIATRMEELFIINLDEIIDKKIGLVKGYAFIEILKERYPTINIVEVDSIKDGLEMVAKGELFGFVDTLPTVGYILQQDYNAQLKIAGKFSDSWELAIAVRKEFSQLTYIFNKAIRAIPESENQQIINNWISVKYEESLDLETITKLFALFLIILALIYLKYVVTKRYNKHLEDEVRRQLEELRKKDIALINQNKLASMGEMVGSIAHQWKQPLNVLHLNIEMLIDDYEDGLIDENFINDFRDKNIDIIKFMVTTIDDFRNFFRVEKVKKDFDVKAGVETIINMQKNYLNKRNISISLKGDGFKTHGFLTEFQQVILNLINNAKDEFVKKEMKNGKVEVILSKEDGTIRVHDNAGGVPEDIINKIFDPYFTTKDIGEGTGIGLHMSKTIVEDHLDGKISVVNRDGGAEFIIYLKAVN